MNAITLDLTPHAVHCPTCKAEPATDCVTPSGATAAKFHVARERALDAATADVTEALIEETADAEPEQPEAVETDEPEADETQPLNPLVADVRAHAEKFQHQNGWDIMVETMTDEDIDAIIGKARTVKGAVDKGRKHMKRLDAARREIIATADSDAA